MFEKRLTVFLFVLLATTIALVGRAFTIQVVNKSYWTAEASASLRRYDTLPTGRGKILDRRGNILALDRPCIDASVDYRAVVFEHDPVWLKNVAADRLRARSDEYEKASNARRKELLADGVRQVKRDLDVMWATLARAGGKTAEEIDETRRDIVRRVETRRRIAWYRKYEKAVASYEKRPPAPWYQQWLLDDTGPGPRMEDFDIRVADETEPQVILPNIDYALRNALQGRVEQYPGLVLQTSVTRVYPYNEAACQLLGHLGKVTREDLTKNADQDEDLREYEASDSIGRSGLEALLERDLRGARGKRESTRAGHETARTDPVYGKDIVTTIDIELQKEIEASFKHISFVVDSTLPMQTIAMPGAAVVIDVKTGEVLSMASYPTFDLNRFDELYAKLAGDYVNRPLMNRATTFALEPGSTVKPIVGIGGITQGILQPNEGIVCNGYLVIDGKTTRHNRCWTMMMFKKTHMTLANPPASDALQFPDALERSCNVFFETVGDRLGIGGLSYWYDRFGLGRPTGVGIAEMSGRIPSDFVAQRRAERGISWSSAIGQSQVAATPMQMANVAATLARSGIWVRPTLVPRSADALSVAARPPAPATNPSPWPERVDLGLSQQAIAEAHDGMKRVVNSPAGTGKAARSDDPGVLTAGKTGSATSAPLKLVRRDASGKLLRDAKGNVSYDAVIVGTTANPNPAAPWYRGIGLDELKPASHAWFIGYAPADNPKIAFAVMVEYGGGGGPAAGGVAKQIVEACKKRGYLN